MLQGCRTVIRRSWPVIVLSLISCSSAPQRLSSVDTAQLKSVTAEVTAAAPLIAVHASRARDRLYIHLKESGDDRYAEIHFAEEVPTDRSQRSTSPIDPYLLSIGELQTNVPFDRQLPGTPLTVLSIEFWNETLDQVFASLIEKTPKHGLVVGLPQEDYFLYLDSGGAIRVTALRHRPDDYRIGGVVRLEDLVSGSTKKLRSLVRKQNLMGNEFLINTGAQRQRSIPFIYVDLATETVALIAYERNLPSGSQGSGVLISDETILHLIKTHIWDLIVRPVSSINRLIFMTTDTAVDTLRPDWISTVAANLFRQ